MAELRRTLEDVKNELLQTKRLCEFISLENEKKVLALLELLLRDDVDLKQFRDPSTRQTPLHCSVEREFVHVTDMLLSNGLDPFEENWDHDCPLALAVTSGKDVLAELVIKKAQELTSKERFDPAGGIVNNFPEEDDLETSEKSRVRKLMSRSNGEEPKINLCDVLQKMPKTTIALLNCLQEEWKQTEKNEVFYKELEADGHGYGPKDKQHCKDRKDKKKNRTAFHIMVHENQLDYLYHPVVKSLLDQKWHDYGWRHYVLNCIVFLFSMIVITISMALCVYTENVLKYDSDLDYARAVFEVLAYLCAVVSLVMELGQLFAHRTSYICHDTFNLLELSSAVLLVTVLVVRYTAVDIHWYFFSFGYLLWMHRIFKYAFLWRSMAVYIDILWQLVREVFPSFAVLFVVQNLIFGGALILALKGDQDVGINNKTSSFHMVELSGLLTLARGGPVIENYVGPKGYKFVSCILLTTFLFMIVIVLLNILIAQLSEALPRALKKVDKNLNFKKAKIICDIERSPFLRCLLKVNRKDHYRSNNVEMEPLRLESS